MALELQPISLVASIDHVNLPAEIPENALNGFSMQNHVNIFISYL